MLVVRTNKVHKSRSLSKVRAIGTSSWCWAGTSGELWHVDCDKRTAEMQLRTVRVWTELRSTETLHQSWGFAQRGILHRNFSHKSSWH
jgi:hypothetical protein